MAEWKEKGTGRIGNTAEPFDEPGGHFSRNPKGRGSFGLWRSHAVATNRSSLMGYASPHRSSFLARGQNPRRRGHAIVEFRP
jgi:hypothetical protein